MYTKNIYSIFLNLSPSRINIYIASVYKNIYVIGSVFIFLYILLQDFGGEQQQQRTNRFQISQLLRFGFALPPIILRIKSPIQIVNAVNKSRREMLQQKAHNNKSLCPIVGEKRGTAQKYVEHVLAAAVRLPPRSLFMHATALRIHTFFTFVVFSVLMCERSLKISITEAKKK